MNASSTRTIYDVNAQAWARNERVLLSDFTARPFVTEALRPLEGKHVLDLGCGEGYVARLAAAAGAASVTGVDVSPEMVTNAQAAVPPNSSCAFHFDVGDASVRRSFARERFDRVMAVFLCNYLTRAQTKAVLATARERLSPGGAFVFTVPHPCFPYMRSPAAPFFFQTERQSYFSGVDSTYEGRIWRRDGTDVPVRCVHKTFEDYFALFAQAGWRSLPAVLELRVRPEHVALDPAFFGPLEGYPLHVLFRLDVS